MLGAVLGAATLQPTERSPGRAADGVLEGRQAGRRPFPSEHGLA